MTAKITFSTAGDSPRHIHQVSAGGTPIGIVQRFGGLPSCQRWSGRDTRTGKWTRSRQTRAQAAADVLAAWQQAGGPS